MNKVSNKLAAGVRKVKEQKKPAPAAAKQVRPNAVRSEASAVKTAPSGRAAIMHPDRIWPD